jgi:hypothetical protein
MLKEEQKFKPTLAKPVSVQSKAYERNFNKTMHNTAPDVKLNESEIMNEIDAGLNEAEQSLKKKIFSLSKMEALVFSDPKLSAIYDQMSINGEEKYGYHYNETIMNMIFNDYVLNSPKYLQKYKIAIPKEKERRDKSGINQLKKAGEEKMSKSGLPIEKKTQVDEVNEPLTKVMFLVNEKDPENPDLFAYFPEEISHGEYKTAYSHIGQHSSAHPRYAEESRPATPEEYAPLKAELESLGYNLEVLNLANESTGAGSSGAFSAPLGTIRREIEETTSAGGGATAGNAGGGANQSGSGAYYTPTAWGDGDLMKVKHKAPVKTKPQYPGGKIIQENKKNYLVDPSDFMKYARELNEADLSYQTKMGKDYKQSHTGSNKGLGVSEVPQSKDRAQKKEGVDNNTTLYIGQDMDKMRKKDLDILHNDMTKTNSYFPNKNNPNLPEDGISGKNKDNSKPKTMEENKILNEKAKSAAQQRLFGMAHEVQKGELSPNKVGGAVKKIAKDVSTKDVEDFASTKHKDLPEKVDEDQTTMANASKTQPKEDSMSNKMDTTIPIGTQQTGGMNENFKLLEEINDELNAYSIHHEKLMKMSEERKPSALILRDRVGNENEKNFKSDMQKSDTKQIIDTEKELQWKDQQTKVGENPYELGEKLEKNEVKTGDMKSGEALKNVGNSTNDEGDEIPKRNFTDEEQNEVNMYRNGQHSWNYDNKPDKRFEDRMKKDMGDKIYDMRQKQLAFKGQAPMYNKDPQPIKNTSAKKVQFDKEQSGWNEREGLKESMITGKYNDILNKRRLIDFKLNEVKIINDINLTESLFELDFTGLGNTYNSKTIDNKVIVNESAVKVISEHKFYTNGKNIFAIKNPQQKLNENVSKEKPIINEQFNKMKHLLGYKPESFTNTNNVKINRGF